MTGNDTLNDLAIGLGVVGVETHTKTLETVRLIASLCDCIERLSGDAKDQYLSDRECEWIGNANEFLLTYFKVSLNEARKMNW